MEDEKILQLYLDRNELAIHESAEKYGAYCRAVAMNILGDPDDAEECVNDTWFKAWNAIPPARPADISGQDLPKPCFRQVPYGTPG